MYKLLIIFSFFIFVGITNAQVTDLARVEYTYFPQSNSDNSFRRFRTLVNIPLKLKEDAYLVPGLEYRNVNLQLDEQFNFLGSDLDRYQSFTIRLGYTEPINEKWRYAIQGGIKLATNGTSNFTKDDFVYEASVYFIKKKMENVNNVSNFKAWRLILGLSYSTTAGRPFPLPIVNYYKEFRPNWSYAAGIPKSNIKYRFNAKHSINAFITLDGFFANIQDNIAIPTLSNTFAAGDNISLTTVLSGVGYEYNITKHLLFYIYAGHTLWNDIRIRDENQNDVLTLNNKNTFYSRGGIKFKI